MKQGMIMKKITKIISAVAALFLIFSCKVGLGEAVDVVAPELTIIAPDVLAAIPQTVTVKGIVSDNMAVDRLIIKIVETDQEFKLAGGTWYENVDSNWIAYDRGICSGSETEYNWELPLSIKNAQNGEEYTITSQVYDKFGNEGKKSKDERCVRIDTVIPVVSIIEPSLTISYEEASESYESYRLEDSSILSNLVNYDFSISGSQKEDSSLDKLYVYLDTSDSSVVSVTDIDSLKTNSLYVCDVQSSNLRNWEIKLTKDDFAAEFQTGKHLLRLVTESHDKAGNIEIKVQGWFVYWNEADRPWIALTAGFENETKAAENTVYPGCTLQGQAYDDDGLSDIVVKVLEKDPGETEYREILSKSYKDELSAASNPTYYAWSVNALTKKCNFIIEVNCTDKYGTQSNVLKKYFEVTDVNPPVFVEFNPLNGSELIKTATAEGKLTLKGKVKDNGEIASLKVVRIGSGKDDTQVNYYNAGFSEWAKATGEGFVDSNGNKIWKIELTDHTVDSDNNHNYKFEKSFNIFTDFGINGTTEKLSTQNFIFIVTDNSGASNIEAYSMQGDSDAPVITITKLQIVKADGTNKETFVDFTNTPKLQPFNKDGEGNITDKIIVSGEWSDNSTVFGNNRTGDISLVWEDASGVVTKSVEGVKNVWTTNAITLPDVTTGALTFTMTDWGGNSKSVTQSFFVNSSYPVLSRINANTVDGIYKAGSEIFITMEFNKNVKFTDEANPPKLKLNLEGNKYATYSSGNGSSIHVFKYVVAPGDKTTDNSPLNVSEIIANGNNWVENVAENAFEATVNLPTGANSLGGARSIKIDTVAPALSSIEFITTTQYLRANNKVFIRANFSEDVNFSDISKLKLALNCNPVTAYADNATKTGGKTVVFSYSTKEGDSVQGLKVTDFVYTGSAVQDLAYNDLDYSTIPANSSSINILTGKPATPVISGITDTTYYSAKTVKISNLDSNTTTTKYYSIDNGASWVESKAAVTEISVSLSSSGTYTVMAYQEDAAGNQSGQPTAISCVIDNGVVLKSITAGKPDGTYSIGTVIPIYLNFRIPVKLTGTPKLTVNVKNGAVENKEAVFDSEKSTVNQLVNQLVFNYTIVDGDECSTALDALTLDLSGCTLNDEKGFDVRPYCNPAALSNSNKISGSRTIKIVTTLPVVKSVTLDSDENKLKIVFNSSISKNEGEIVITQSSETPFLAPVVISKSDFTNYSKNTTITNNYHIGTNGADEDGNADLTEKYILDFAKNSNDNTIITALKTLDADKVKIDVNSTAVTLETSEDNTPNSVLVLDLSSTYKLPVKGAKYNVKIPADLVQDSLNNKNLLDESKSVSYSGVEKPVIRINKVSEKIYKDGETMKVAQNKTTTFKIDCQTPGAEIKYTVGTQTQKDIYLAPAGSDGATSEDSVVLRYNGTATTNKAINKTNNNIPAFNPNSWTTESTFSLSTAEEENGKSFGSNDYNAKKYLIKATADSSLPAYEAAMKTVIRFKEGSKKEGINNTDFNSFTRWIRGGDWTNGGVATPDFPLSWDTSDFSKTRAMTKVTESEVDYWYWVTWNLNTTAYVGILVGDLPEDAATNGPGKWCWSSSGWVPEKQNYPIYPGEKTILNASTDISNKYNGYTYLGWKHAETRESGKVEACKLAKDASSLNIQKSVTIDGENPSVELLQGTEIESSKVVEISKIGDADYSGCYLVVKTAKYSDWVALFSKSINIQAYPNGEETIYNTINDVGTNKTYKIKISDELNNTWKYNSIYIGGKNVNISSVQLVITKHKYSGGIDQKDVVVGNIIKFNLLSTFDDVVPDAERGLSVKGTLCPVQGNAASGYYATYTIPAGMQDWELGATQKNIYGIGCTVVENDETTESYVVKSPYSSLEFPDFNSNQYNSCVVYVEWEYINEEFGIDESDCYLYKAYQDQWNKREIITNLTGTSTSYNYPENWKLNNWKVYGYGIKIKKVSITGPNNSGVETTWTKTLE